MVNERHKREKIVAKLLQIDVVVGLGMVRADAIREVRMPMTGLSGCGNT